MAMLNNQRVHIYIYIIPNFIWLSLGYWMIWLMMINHQILGYFFSDTHRSCCNVLNLHFQNRWYSFIAASLSGFGDASISQLGFSDLANEQIHSGLQVIASMWPPTDPKLEETIIFLHSHLEISRPIFSQPIHRSSGWSNDLNIS